MAGFRFAAAAPLSPLAEMTPQKQSAPGAYSWPNQQETIGGNKLPLIF
jgi:hypothetical protein